MRLIEINIDSIIALCKIFRVRSLAVFGSILTDRFNDNNDVNLLVDFGTTDHEQWDYLGNYFGFRDALENLFGRKVDLIKRGGIRNPLFLKSIDCKKQMIYG